MRKDFPIKYLGLPLSTGKLRRADIWPLIDKYSGKFKGWKPRFLRASGRLTLTKSVLMALPVHLLAVLPIPQWALDIINRRCRGFVWKGEDDVNGGHCLLPWARVCTPLQTGGLGVLNLRFFGTALRCRWPWLRWAADPRPWTLVPVTDDRDALQLFKAAVSIQMGDGRRAKFWTDNWLPGGRSVEDTMPALFSYVKKPMITVADALNNHRWVRDIAGGLSTQALAQYLQLWDLVTEVALTDGQDDKAVWRCNADGKFSVSSAYNLFFIANTRFACAKPIWKSKAPMKCRLFMWLAVHKRCLTADNLQKRNWPHNPTCALCQAADEDCTHLFLHCRFTQQVWQRFRTWTKASFPIPGNDFRSTEEWWIAARKVAPKTIRRDFDTISILLHWQIWKERNARIFQNEFCTVDRVLELIIEEIRTWRAAGCVASF
jgi:hypothetical protein